MFDAVSGRLVGEEAAIEMIMWNQVSLSFKGLPDKKIMRRINSELMPIMMEASRRKDEKLQENELGVFDESFEQELNFLEDELSSLKADKDLLGESSESPEDSGAGLADAGMSGSEHSADTGKRKRPVADPGNVTMSLSRCCPTVNLSSPSNNP